METPKSVLVFVLFFVKFEGFVASADTKIICENAIDQLVCGENLVHVLDAHYGITATLGECKSSANVACISDRRVIDKVRKACQDHHFCWLKASDDQFYDPCVLMTNKYLNVTYACVKPSDTRLWMIPILSISAALVIFGGCVFLVRLELQSLKEDDRSLGTRTITLTSILDLDSIGNTLNKSLRLQGDPV